MRPPEPARILVVEDEEAIAQGLLFNLERKGHSVELESNGREALERVRAGRYDLILLDVRLPEMDGFEVCQSLRSEGNFTPIVILTARSQPDDVIYGLKLGADDYVVKPFDLAELLARVEGMLRRQEWSRQEGAGEGAATAGGTNGQAAATAESTSVTSPALPTLPTSPPTSRRSFGEYWVDFETYEALTNRGVVQLSHKELAVMRVFLNRPHQVITRRELLAEVWELPQHPNTRVVDNVIVALRQAFEADSAHPRHILSVRGVGYRFVP
ncbi:MAG TPA: response regulator transcription factor [Thermoanaerobaculia bacterium]|nr:response regulator transcription factor [Thermoanaerobaculia bacterium]